MCPDNLTEFSRRATNEPGDQYLLYTKFAKEDGVRTIPVHQVSGKRALKAYLEQRRIREENKENIPPVLSREEAFKQDDDKKSIGHVVHQEKRHDDSGEHVPA